MFSKIIIVFLFLISVVSGCLLTFKSFTFDINNNFKIDNNVQSTELQSNYAMYNLIYSDGYNSLDIVGHAVMPKEEILFEDVKKINVQVGDVVDIDYIVGVYKNNSTFSFDESCRIYFIEEVEDDIIFTVEFFSKQYVLVHIEISDYNYIQNIDSAFIQISLGNQVISYSKMNIIFDQNLDKYCIVFSDINIELVNGCYLVVKIVYTSDGQLLIPKSCVLLQDDNKIFVKEIVKTDNAFFIKDVQLIVISETPYYFEIENTDYLNSYFIVLI